MQLSAQILQADWHVLLGWALIVAGIALAAQTLAGLRKQRSGAAHIMRAYRPAEWSASQSAHERTPRMDPAGQLQRLTAVVERRFAQIEAIADMNARAAAEVEAVDAALGRLLADFTPDAILSVRQREVDPARLAEPLAA